jgi:hypothetical protein
MLACQLFLRRACSGAADGCGCSGGPLADEQSPAVNVTYYVTFLFGLRVVGLGAVGAGVEGEHEPGRGALRPVRPATADRDAGRAVRGTATAIPQILELPATRQLAGRLHSRRDGRGQAADPTELFD